MKSQPGSQLSREQSSRDRAREATCRKILEAATELLLAEGVEGFSMRKLASKIGLTPTAIYFHFPDKESLLGAVVAEQFRVFRNAFERISREKDPIRRLSKMGMAYTEFGLNHPDHYYFMFMASSLDDVPKGRFLEKGNPAQDCYAFLVETVKEAMAEQRFRKELTDVDQISQIFFAAVHGVVALHIVKGKDDWVAWRPIRPKVKRMIAALIRGMTRDAEEID